MKALHTVSNPVTLEKFWSSDPDLQEGSRIYTPVRLGFPRQTLDGTSYEGKPIPKDMLVTCNLMAGNRGPVAFDRPNEYLPERWLEGRRGRTDMPGEGGHELGVTHLTYGCCRRVCLGIDMANRGLYSTLVLLLHFFSWECYPLREEAKRHIFPPFRATRECSLEMDAIKDTATPTEAQTIPWSAGIKFTCRDPAGLRAWIVSESIEHACRAIQEYSFSPITDRKSFGVSSHLPLH